MSRCVLVPVTCTFDKLCALYAYVTFVMQASLDEMIILFDREMGDASKITEEIYDIDVRSRYHDTPYGSAFEVLVREFGVKQQGLELLIDLVNSNNQTANLKMMHESFVWLIRILYEVNHNVERYAYRRKVIAALWPVVETYFDAIAADETAVRQRLNERGDIFTLRGYAYLMEVAGHTEAEIKRETRRCTKLFQLAYRRNQQSRNRAASLNPKEVFRLQRKDGASTVLGHFIESDDQRIVPAYLREKKDAVLLLVRKPKSGHYGIFVRGEQDLRSVHDVLDELEPGRWYILQPSKNAKHNSPALLNSGPSAHVPASEISPKELITIIRTRYRHVARQQQR